MSAKAVRRFWPTKSRAAEKRATVACGCVIKHPGYDNLYRAMRLGLPTLDVIITKPCTQHGA